MNYPNISIPLRTRRSSHEFSQRASDAQSPLSPKPSPIERMRANLVEKLHNKTNLDDAFWCEMDLQQLWKEKYVEKFLELKHSEDLSFVRAEFNKILSVLVYSECFDAGGFQEHFLQARRTDKSLPFKDLEWLSKALGSDAARQAFYRNQSKSIPIYIDDKEKAHIQLAESLAPLPFASPTEEVASGGFGQVFRALVPPRYIRTVRESGKQSDSNDQVS